MKYKKYDVNDFVLDEHFQKWVLHSDKETDAFWAKWLMSHPEKEEVVLEAVSMVQSLHKRKSKFTIQDIQDIWDKIDKDRAAYERQKDLGREPDTENLFPFEEDDKKQEAPKRIFPWLRAAAMIVVIIGSSYGVYVTGVFNKKAKLNTEPRVTLELQDGTIKTLSEQGSGMVTTVNGKQVVKQEKTTLIYRQDNATAEDGELVYNQLTVPYGKTFELVLADGSKVMLNSGSKLRYPVNFLKGSPRNVFLDGEAYFQVAKDTTRTFTVVTDHMNTEVYGTTFNVSSYKNEKNTFSVLLEGSIGVYQPNSTERGFVVKIEPGQRAVFENGKIDVEQVNVHKYTAWTTGELFFMKDRFELVLKELERHYNVSIDNRYYELNEIPFTATFTNDESLDKVLKLFQAHTPFTYKRNGNIITINKPPNN
ncbi:FecR family protein [Sinomicrobium weinanense]|uniref:DUF4974 domain-containing protein n=1 Tax=Sinomicrobium weinanense TaxID=2842200 RepID=A0A926JQ85_9FLAO|nr:FecR family protein [Sinomicrobium weinanense]MBC9795379.1 DUF4974 domain-containing protein [Sinomicrobium weinanense]MBU3122906.1 DUF4974 domain-containing protein [Sinomicrobium weinanense]